MGRIFTRANKKSSRRFLRKKATKAERLLWGELRSNKLGVKFRRQHSIGRYIVDFYCPSKKISIEIDGDSHRSKNVILYDEIRTHYLSQFQIQELRFTNDEVEKDTQKVVKSIKNALFDRGDEIP